MSGNTLQLRDSISNGEITPLQILEHEKKQIQEGIFTIKKTYVNTKYWIQNLVDDMMKQIPQCLLETKIHDIQDIKMIEIFQSPEKLISYFENMKFGDKIIKTPYLSPNRRLPVTVMKFSTKSKTNKFRKMAVIDSISKKKIKVVGHWKRF